MNKATKYIFIFTLFVFTTSLHSQTGPGGVGNNSTNVLWLDANKIVGLADNDDVLSWIDVSGNSNTFESPSAVFSPIYKAGIVNGYSLVRFNKFNGRIRKTNFSNFPTTDITAIYVNKNNGETSDGILSYASSTNNNDFLLFRSSNLRLYRINPRTSGQSFNDNQWHIANVSWQSTGGAVNVWKDGNLGYSTTNLQPNTTIASNGTLALASEQDAIDGNYDATQTHFGDFPEVIIYNIALNTAQNIIVSNYLSAKYNTTLASNNFYDEDENGDFDHNVAGIGQASNGTNHTDSQGTGIVRISAPTDLQNDEYLFWGGNQINPTYNFSAVAPDNDKYRLNNVWRVSETGDVGDITVAINQSDLDLTGAPDGTYKLIRSTASDFTTIDEEYDLTLSGGVFTTTANFNDNDYFTVEIVSMVDLELTKTVNNALPKVGDTIIFTLNLTNNGSHTATGVMVRDILPANLAYNAGSSNISSGTYNETTGDWDLTSVSIPNGTTISIQIAATVTAKGLQTNTAQIININQTDTDSTPNNGN